MSVKSSGWRISCGLMLLAAGRLAGADEQRTLDCETTFPPEITAAHLSARFGAEKVMSAAIGIGEGLTEPGTLVFPDSPMDRIEVLWRDAASLRTPSTIGVVGDESRWATVQGISLGIDLATLERINGQPFVLAGFAWDYQGTVTSWSGGLLDYFSDQCRIFVRLAPKLRDDDPQWTALYESLVGDREFSSNHPAMQELNPTIYEVTLVYKQ